MDIKQLIREALLARKNAYAPYSHYQVGAAVLTEEGRIFSGCNVENSSSPNGICAEKNAVSTAVAQGSRKIQAVAVVGGPEGKSPELCFPCGSCRQVLLEFGDPESLQVILAEGAEGEESYQIYSLEELLPHGFRFSNREKGEKYAENV